jgi:transcriptional regulator with XRE-family HTH domain
MKENNILLGFGNSLRSLRNQYNLSQENFAYQCNLDRTYISGLERGKRNPTLLALHKIATSLDMSLSELFIKLNEVSKCQI